MRPRKRGVDSGAVLAGEATTLCQGPGSRANVSVHVLHHLQAALDAPAAVDYRASVRPELCKKIKKA